MAAESLIQLGRAAPVRNDGLSTPTQVAASGAAVYVETYGCQMNAADSDMISGILSEAGFARANSAEAAQVVLINTCAVREKAEEKVVARIGELATLRRQRGAVVGILGCMAGHLKERLANKPVDLVLGPDAYRRLPALLNERLHGERLHGQVNEPALDVKLDKHEMYEGLSGAVGGDGVSGFITIQRGCNKFCTFCVVPYTRGRERGMPPRDILRQTAEYVAAGYKEVVLLGQTVNSYVWEDVTFADLLRAVARTPGLERVRFTSPYPVDFTDDVIAAIAETPQVCKYIHLPVQSGSDDVLLRMRRGYTRADFVALVHKLRDRMPLLALSTDILTGFCGETEADHQATLDLLQQVRFDSAFMFAYSERDVTVAAKRLADDVPEETKKRRLREIVELQEAISAEAFAAHIGRTERVLVHGPSKKNPRQLMARTDGFKTVILPDDTGAIGQTLEVKIHRANKATLFAFA